VIAEELGISTKTVGAHLENARAALKARTTAHLVALYIKTLDGGE
jgi:DNA-binding CsgD family transcriptional regulator